MTINATALRPISGCELPSTFTALISPRHILRHPFPNPMFRVFQVNLTPYAFRSRANPSTSAVRTLSTLDIDDRRWLARHTWNLAATSVYGSELSIRAYKYLFPLIVKIGTPIHIVKFLKGKNCVAVKRPILRWAFKTIGIDCG